MSELNEFEEPEILTEDLIDPQDCETVCTICFAEFLDPEDLTLHLSQVHPTEPPSIVQCQFCVSSLSDLEKYALHIRDHHLHSLKVCNYCTKIFVDYDQHRKHERRHFCAKKDYRSCSQCSASFLSNVELERHEYEQHNNEEDGFMLHDIFPILSCVLNMKAIDFLHSINNKKDLECMCCGFISSKINMYLDHLQMHNCRSLACDNCSYTHKYKKNIFRHIKKHKECYNYVKGIGVKCLECQKKISSHFYNSHIKICKPIKCGPCDIVFSGMDELALHQCNSHPLAVEVKLCKFCSRQCVGAYSLKKHMIRVHKHDILEYKYKCVKCNTPFKHPRKLFAHYFLKHKDLEPYTCKICHKTFRIRKRFTIHIKLDHESVGFVEFDKNYNVFFTEKKSEDPFIPTCVLPEEELRMYMESPSKSKDSDVISQTETDGHLTEIEPQMKKKVLKRKITRKLKKHDDVVPLESSDEDTPLVTLKRPKFKPDKRALQSLWARKKNSLKNNREQLTCKTCNKYCYTFQNYQHHMSLHRNNVVKTCIKCSEVFKSKEKLNQHIENEHSSSKLTETLKNLLEKRKQSTTAPITALTTREKFQKTIKKSKTDTINTTAAKVTPVENGLSVQKFLETFTPEGDNTKTQNVFIKNSVSIKKVADPFYRKSTIQMTKFVPALPIDNPKLTLPTKFKPCESEPAKCTIKVVLNEPQNDYLNDNFEDEGVDRDDSIPEVAHEVMLEGSEEPPKQINVPSKIILPEIPQGCENISIAHLQSEAPYYKIVKVNEIISETPKMDETRKDLIRLPDGTRMITVNPLAHLLGDKNVDEILQPLKNKYYKPKMARNVENMLTKALEKANTPTNVRKRKSAAKKLIKTELLDGN